MSRPRPFSPIFLLALSLVAAACGRAADRADRTAEADGEVNAYGLRGRVLPGPLAKPELVLTDAHHRPFDLRAETAGKLTLVFFGYTHCPDICPIHMASIASVLDGMLPSQRERIEVVFVTTDPERDTPERLRTWLANFSPDFVGLTGDTATINAAQRALYMPLPQYGEADSTGAYLVGHAAAVIAFTPDDDQARVLYPFGIRQADWANDLPKLLEIDWDD